MKKFRFWAILLSLAIVISSFALVSVSASESESGDGAPYEYVVVLGGGHTDDEVNVSACHLYFRFL